MFQVGYPLIRMASKAPIKAKKTKAPAVSAVASSRKASRPSRPSKPSKERQAVRSTVRPRVQKPLFVPRAMSVTDDDDSVLMAHGAGGGAGFGRCGGRLLGSKLEQTLCDRLSQSGVAHSHSPRHFEVRLQEGQVAAYAPMIVLRGRGREGKSVVIEASDDHVSPLLKKIVAHPRRYYVNVHTNAFKAGAIRGQLKLKR